MFYLITAYKWVKSNLTEIVAFAGATAVVLLLLQNNSLTQDVAKAENARVVAEGKLQMCQNAVSFQNAGIQNHAIDAAKKDEAFKNEMNSKPRYITKYVYQESKELNVTAEQECKDLRSLVDEYIVNKTDKGEIK